MPIKRNKPKRILPGIWRDGPGRYLVVVWRTDPKTGRKSKMEGVVPSREEAVLLHRKMREEGKREKELRVRFADFAEHWLEAQAHRLAPSTRDRYIVALARWCEALGAHWVDTLEASDVRRFRDEHIRRGAAPATVNGWLRVLRVVLDPAVEDGQLGVNPARSVKTVPERRTQGARGTALSVPEFRRLLEAIETLAQTSAIPEDVGRHLLAYAWTGMRRGEGLALRRSDCVDGELFVTRSVYGVLEKSTKTDDPRIVVVSEPLAKVLAAQENWLVETEHPGLSSGLFFPASPRHVRGGATRRGADEVTWYRSPNVLYDALHKVVDAAGLPNISLQSFRRSYENLLRKAGVDQLVRRSMAGWRTDQAQAIYAGVDREERTQAAAAIVELIDAPRTRVWKSTPASTPGGVQEGVPMES